MTTPHPHEPSTPPPVSLTFKVMSLDRNVLDLFFPNAPARDSHPVSPQVHSLVFDQEVPWDGPQPPVLRGNCVMRAVRWRSHRRRMEQWRLDRKAWEEAGRPPRKQRTILPHAVIEDVSGED